MLTRSVIRFGIVGVVNTLIGLLIIFGAKWFLGLGDLVANALGYTVGVSISFILNSRWTFGYKGRLLPAVVRFIITLGIAYLVNLAVVFYCIHELILDSYVAQAAGVIPYTVVFYLGSRMFAFEESSDRRRFNTDIS